jgi:hypothetical protein
VQFGFAVKGTCGFKDYYELIFNAFCALSIILYLCGLNFIGKKNGIKRTGNYQTQILTGVN